MSSFPVSVLHLLLLWLEWNAEEACFYPPPSSRRKCNASASLMDGKIEESFHWIDSFPCVVHEKNCIPVPSDVFKFSPYHWCRIIAVMVGKDMCNHCGHDWIIFVSWNKGVSWFPSFDLNPRLDRMTWYLRNCRQKGIQFKWIFITNSFPLNASFESLFIIHVEIMLNSFPWTTKLFEILV